MGKVSKVAAPAIKKAPVRELSMVKIGLVVAAVLVVVALTCVTVYWLAGRYKWVNLGTHAARVPFLGGLVKDRTYANAEASDFDSESWLFKKLPLQTALELERDDLAAEIIEKGANVNFEQYAWIATKEMPLAQAKCEQNHKKEFDAMAGYISDFKTIS